MGKPLFNPTINLTLYYKAKDVELWNQRNPESRLVPCDAGINYSEDSTPDGYDEHILPENHTEADKKMAQRFFNAVWGCAVRTLVKEYNQHFSL